MNKLLIVCGPTASGKTKLALHLAKVSDGELVSADSRQVYKGLDLGTGKDRGDGSIKVWGYDIVGSKEKYSVSQYVYFANKIISNIGRRGKLPILVGGTGLFIKAVLDGIGTVDVVPNEDLRSELAGLSPSELYKRLFNLDSTKASSLNESDRKNPRRLIRAIEIVSSDQTTNTSMHRYQKKKKFDFLEIGLTADKKILEERIKTRVERRVRDGIENEIKSLLARGVGWGDQSMTSLGYAQWQGYFEGAITKDEVINDWINAEVKYAKRQMTWFRKDKRINWFNIVESDYRKKVENEVKKWYHRA